MRLNAPNGFELDAATQLVGAQLFRKANPLAVPGSDPRGSSTS